MTDGRRRDLAVDGDDGDDEDSADDDIAGIA
jgi:hypothetical protein